MVQPYSHSALALDLEAVGAHQTLNSPNRDLKQYKTFVHHITTT